MSNIKKKITQSSQLNIFPSSHCVHKRGKIFFLIQRPENSVKHCPQSTFVRQLYFLIFQNCTCHMVAQLALWLLSGQNRRNFKNLSNCQWLKFHRMKCFGPNLNSIGRLRAMGKEFYSEASILRTVNYALFVLRLMMCSGPDVKIFSTYPNKIVSWNVLTSYN